MAYLFLFGVFIVLIIRTIKNIKNKHRENVINNDKFGKIICNLKLNLSFRMTFLRGKNVYTGATPRLLRQTLAVSREYERLPLSVKGGKIKLKIITEQLESYITQSRVD